MGPSVKSSIPSFAFTNVITLVKFLSLFVLQFLHLLNKHNNINSLTCYCEANRS